MTREPTAPDSIPNYISDGLPKQSDETLRDVIAFTEELLEERDNAEPELPDDVEVIEEDTDNGGSIVEEKVTCGKSECKCADGDLHGPYKYRYWSENGTTQKEYVGKAN